MGHESDVRNSGTQEKLRARKTDNDRGTRENTAFPLSASFLSAGCLTAHPQGRSVAKDAERCAGGLPTENKAREGSRRRHVVHCWYCRAGLQGPGWYCCKFRQG